ncbi:hypothetical protein E2C01_049280 [Portunus trituberculatus]|uniref:Secreted protein n=1 Tax=Portunus trituberculatus TaxID=210409 RepID=A0A5B7GDF8_PORTR|nr:hypothetical protein [Portunus trituberculatus]
MINLLLCLATVVAHMAVCDSSTLLAMVSLPRLEVAQSTIAQLICEWKDGRSSYLRPHEPSALEIAAEQMRLWPNIENSKFIILILLISLAHSSDVYVFKIRFIGCNMKKRKKNSETTLQYYHVKWLRSSYRLQ